MNRTRERCLAFFAWASATAVFLGVAAVVGFVLTRSGPALGPALLFGKTRWWAAVLGKEPVFDGLWPALVGTLSLVIGASAVAIPTGVAAGVYLAEFADGRLKRALEFTVDLLAGVPSIIMGLFGFGLILFLRRTLLPNANTCLLLAMLCIAALVLPFLIRATETALNGLPASLRLLGPSLGLSDAQTLLRIRLPAASRGILSGVIMSMGRAAEDTAVILLTGAVASAGLPHSLLDKFEALPFTIYYLSAQYRTEAQLQRAFGAAAVLLAFTAVMFALAHRLHAGLERRWEAGR
ncbi:MAG: ABC transporter permease subunit [Kiritimatiellae bacterium]|nr:ABC transporter permease subunit [Kiritimatiellia bacterium]